MLSLLKTLVVTIVIIISTVTLIIFLQQLKTKDIAEDIISLEGMHVAPLDSSTKDVPSFSGYADVIEKKRAFFAYLQPEIQRQNKIVIKERQMVFALQAVFLQQQAFNEHQKKKYSIS